MTAIAKIKRPVVMYCIICGKEIMTHEEFDFVQTKRKATMYWHKNCYSKSHKGVKNDSKGIN